MDGTGGSRISWADVPAPVRAAIEGQLGSAVTEAVTQQGGFSPGMAARLRLADGRRVFAKAVGLDRNPESPAMYRDEAVIAAQLPDSPATPKLLWSYDDGDWVALVFEDIDGRNPAVPWKPDEFQRVHDALVLLSDVLTPSPVDTVRAADKGFSGWQALAADPVLAARLDPFARSHVDRLAGFDAQWSEAVDGDTLLHLDIRADNILLAGDRVVLVDWPHAAVGAAWIDLVGMLPSVAMQGGPRPADVWDASPLSAKADPDAVTCALASVTGFFVHMSLLPPPVNLPKLREFQRIQGEHALAWLRERLR